METTKIYELIEGKANRRLCELVGVHQPAKGDILFFCDRPYRVVEREVDIEFTTLGCYKVSAYRFYVVNISKEMPKNKKNYKKTDKENED